MNIVSTASRYSYNILEDDTKELISEYPFLEKIRLGNSVLGNELFCLKAGTGGRKIFIIASQRGNEWITSALVMRMLEELCFLYTNNSSLHLIDVHKALCDSSIYVCPMVNPDGVELSTNGIPKNIPPITKNRLISYNSGSNDFKDKWQANINGIDLSHNYDVNFFERKATESHYNIFSQCSSHFSGHHPFSEPETAALKKFTLSLMPDVTITFQANKKAIHSSAKGKSFSYASHLAETLSEISGYNLCEISELEKYSHFCDWSAEKLDTASIAIDVGNTEGCKTESYLDEIFAVNLHMLLYIMK